MTHQFQPSAPRGFAAAFVWTCWAAASAANAGDEIEYNRDIRPILAENCFACHGPDSAARKAGLRLDQRPMAVEMAAIVPGDPDSSELIRRVFSADAEEMMPPPMTKKQLTAEQKDLLRRWIAGDAPYQPHWSLIAPVRPQPPAVRNEAWVRNPIDRFVLARLEAMGLSPAPEADRRTLARRLSLDLTGLPPVPADVEAFLNDSSSDAYEKYVDHLLGSIHWGEHRGRYWLDVARYADTHGIHFDNFREIWTYRDWVIGAFNRNLPFDQFTIEQLAGDLLPNRTLEQQIASGFNRCNITTNEGGAIAEEYLVLYNRDRTETTSQVWLGLTAGCAVCHDHKFDPLSQREFYELAAFFNNTTQAAMDGNIADTPPKIFVPLASDRPRWEELADESADVKRRADERRQTARAEFDGWLAAASPEAVRALAPTDGLRLQMALAEGSGNTVQAMLDGQPRPLTVADGVGWKPGHIAAQAYVSQPGAAFELAEAGDFEKDQAFACGAWVQINKGGQSGSIVARMDDQHDYRGWDIWLEAEKPAIHIIHKWSDDALKVAASEPLKVGEWNHLLVSYDGSGKAAGVRIYVNGRPQATSVQVDRLSNTVRTEVPFKVAQRHTGQRLDELALGDLRLYGRAVSANESERIARTTRAAWLAGKPAEGRTDPEKNELYDWWLASMDKAYQDLAAKQSSLGDEQSAIQSRSTIAHVMQEKDEPAMAYVLFRGEYEKRRDEVRPQTPSALPAMPGELPRNRLGFAQWLLRPEHPLTTRVTVNRFWQEVFGSGLVRTAGDFGVSGELPSHPELLDWLAVEFRATGWNVKQFFKLLVTSAAYRQSAATTPEKLEKDQHNRFLSRGPRFRMDAEMVRDYALAASGLLVEKIGGPSVRPYQPDGVWEAVAMIGSNTRDYQRDTGENLYRRSMYTFWKRSAPPASLDVFNAPSREICTVRRERTNTPLQALVTLNDVQFVEAARHLATGAIHKGGETAAGKVDWMALRLLARPLTAEEQLVAQATLTDLETYYAAHGDDAQQIVAVGESKADATIDAATLAAWTMLANELMNLDEVLNK
ncbi:MAG TPA: DUF1553 domain-containing protein [Pirellulales bacterium]|jgi:mono/diheme cytochrome c family protein|nr:DUF1553 domain-containing protein [Pirellulales bacterium]